MTARHDTQQGTRNRVVVGGLIGLALLGGSTIAAASIPDGDGTFHGCVNNTTGAVRIIDTAKSGNQGTCITTGPAVFRETAITWNAQGPPGDPATPPAPHTEVVGFLDLPALAGDPIALHGLTIGAERASAPAGGGGAGVVEVGNLVVAKVTDTTSPSLSEAAASGAHLPSALVRLTDGAGATYAELQLADVVVRGVAADSSDAAGELVTLGFSSVTAAAGPGETPTPAAPIGSLASPDLPVESPLLSLTWGVANSSGGVGGGGAGSAQFDDVVVTQPVDASAVTLFNSVLTGAHLPTVTVTHDLPADGEVFELADVVVHTATLVATGAADAVPVLQTGFAYTQVDRSVAGESFCWDTVQVSSC